MDRDQLVAAIRANLEERAPHQKIIDDARKTFDDVTGAVRARGANDLTEDESKRIGDAKDAADKARGELARLDRERAETEQRVEDIDATEKARAAAAEASAKYGVDTGGQAVRVGAEPDVYRRDGEISFFADLFRHKVDADPSASDRLIRHQRQTQSATRAATSGDFAGMVPPTYLTDDFAPTARQGRPFAEAVGGRPLPPDGLTINIPRGTTGVIVLSQTTEGTAVAEQDVDWEDIVVPVRTIAGRQIMSRQSVDRGRNTDSEIMADLAGAYAAELDRQMINGSGANGQHLGILSTTDVASITVDSEDPVIQIRQIADAIQTVHSSRFLTADLVLMHPRRWAYFAQATDSNNRPLVTPAASGRNVFGTGVLGDTAIGVAGELYGLPVVLDANMPTTISSTTFSGATEDAIVVTRTMDLRLFEEAAVPNRVRLDDGITLGGALNLAVVAWSYSAWSAGRYPSATAVLSGSGMQAPTFAT